jgi:hypothetical protein
MRSYPAITSTLATLALLLGAPTPAPAAPACKPGPRFEVRTGGTVYDTVTRLEWQQASSATGMTWAAANTYCSAGFRLPTVKELLSIVDLTVTSGARIDPTAFPGTPANGFWTSSPVSVMSSRAWIVGFSIGSTGYNPDTETPVYVRCVR